MLIAAASVIAPPNPNIVWNFVLLSSVKVISQGIDLLEKLAIEYSSLLPLLVVVYATYWSACTCISGTESQYVELQTHTIASGPTTRLTQLLSPVTGWEEGRSNRTSRDSQAYLRRRVLRHENPRGGSSYRRLLGISSIELSGGENRKLYS